MNCKSAHLGQHARIDLLAVDGNCHRLWRSISAESIFRDLFGVEVLHHDEAVQIDIDEIAVQTGRRQSPNAPVDIWLVYRKVGRDQRAFGPIQQASRKAIVLG